MSCWVRTYVCVSEHNEFPFEICVYFVSFVLCHSLKTFVVEVKEWKEKGKNEAIGNTKQPNASASVTLTKFPCIYDWFAYNERVIISLLAHFLLINLFRCAKSYKTNYRNFYLKFGFYNSSRCTKCFTKNFHWHVYHLHFIIELTNEITAQHWKILFIKLATLN